MHFLFSNMAAFLVTVFSIVLIKPLALRLGLVDVPGGRKHHQGNVPLVGGIAMFLGLMFALLTLPISLSDYRSFIAGYALLVLVGVLDDFKELSANARLMAQIVAALLMTCWGGNVIHFLGNLLGFGPIYLGNWNIPFTLFAIVGLINAVNMSDGMDGLAGGLAFIELTLLIILALQTNLFANVYLLSLLFCVVIGFLVFNWPLPWREHALVFMGDAGSMPLGFALVWFLVSLSQGENPAASPITMLWIMTVPLIDMFNVMLRRILHERSPLAPDRQHVHHLLIVLGFSSLQTTAILCASALFFGLVGLWGEYHHIHEAAMFYGFVGLFVIYSLLSQCVWRRQK